MILSDKQILDEMDKGTILIEPYERQFLGTNSFLAAFEKCSSYE